MKFKICTIFMVLFLIQASFAKSIDTSKSFESVIENAEQQIPKYLLSVYTVSNLIPLNQQFAKNAAEASRQLLQDNSLLANDQAEVLEFKNKLTMFVEKYDANKESLQVLDTIDMYGSASDYYLELPKDKLTPASTFILKLLNKYKHKEVKEEFIKRFDQFVENFKQVFEKTKSFLGKPVLDWYKKFITLTDFKKRHEAFGFLIELA